MLQSFFGASVDWSATGSMLSGFAGWGGVGALVWATFKGRQTIKDVTRQRQAEKAMDAAERVLAAAYNGRSAMSGVRGNLMEGAEFAKANQALLDAGHDLTALSDNQRRKLETAQAFYNRLNSVRSELAAVWEVTPIALAYFGDEVHKALEAIAQQARVVQVAADCYAEDNGDDPEFTSSIRADLWSGHGKFADVDPVAAKIAEAVDVIEKRLLPLLRSEQLDRRQ